MTDDIYNRRPCKLCGKPVIMVQDEAGKWQCLDEKAPCYMLTAEDGGTCRRLINAHVSHFATCSHANAFSKKGKATT